MHRLDPRIKLGGLFVGLASIFMSADVLGVAVSGCAVITLVCLTGTGWRVWLIGLRRFSWMLVIVGGMNLFAANSGNPAVLFGVQMPFSEGGLLRCLLLSAQITLAIALSMILTFTTTPVELTRGIERLVRPLEKFSVPVGNLGLVLLLAMRFVPMVQQELTMTVEAQKSRGVEFARGRIGTRARNLVAVLAPTLAGVLRRADLLALAMAARGFRAGIQRSELRPLRLSRVDYYAVAIAAVFFGGRLFLVAQ